MSAVKNRIAYTPGQLYRNKRQCPPCKPFALDIILQLGIRRNHDCQAGRRKERSLPVVGTQTRPLLYDPVRDTSRQPVCQSVQNCPSTDRQRPITQAGPNSVPCIYVLNATIITKANGFEQIATDVNSIGADIIVLTETWMKEKYADDAFTISGYIWLRKDRVTRHGGGVAAFVKQDLQPTRTNVQSIMQHTEDLWFAVTLTSELVNFCACYYQPKSTYESSEFIRHLSDNIGLMLETDPGSVFVLTGDLNRLDTTELQTQQGLDQIVNVPTHKKITSLTSS